MRSKLIALLVLLIGVMLSFGCTTYSGFSSRANLRRVMIAGEQMKLIHQDVDRLLDVEEYPTFGRWYH